MDQDATNDDALKARRDALRERLRAKCEKIVAAVEALAEPKTFLEAERAARAVIVADKMVERVFSEPKSVKADVRSRSQRVLVDQSVNAPIVSFAATSPAMQRKMKSGVSPSSAKSVDEARAFATKTPFHLPSHKVLKSGASSVIIGAKRPDVVLKACLKGLGP